MAVKLKPCPFCGGQNIREEDDGQFRWIQCMKCGARAGIGGDDEGPDETAWNTRVEQDKLQAELDRLEDKIDEDLIPTLAYIKTVVTGEVPEDSVKIQRIQKALKDF